MTRGLCSEGEQKPEKVLYTEIADKASSLQEFLGLSRDSVFHPKELRGSYLGLRMQPWGHSRQFLSQGAGGAEAAPESATLAAQPVA